MAPSHSFPDRIAAMLLLLLAPHWLHAGGEAVYQKVEPSVVAIKTLEGSGTGFVISSQGYILSNFHVVGTPVPMEVTLTLRSRGNTTNPFTTKAVQLVGVHPEYDLAMLKVTLPAGRTAIPVSFAPAVPPVGATVYAIGNPGLGAQALDKSVSEGALNSARREFEGLRHYQFSAAINPGNSGGPLCDERGRVFGVATFKAAQGVGLGFAVPVSSKLGRRDFVAVAQRRTRPDAAQRLTAQGHEYFNRAGKRRGAEAAADHATAMALYKEAYAHSPADDRIRFYVGDCYARLGRAGVIRNGDEIASHYLQAVLKADGPAYSDACATLGLTAHHHSKYEEAVKWWQKGLKKQALGSGECALLLARNCLSAKRHLDAVVYAEWGVGLVESELARAEEAAPLETIRSQAMGRLTAAEKTQLPKRLAALPVHRKARRDAPPTAFPALSYRLPKIKWGSAGGAPLTPCAAPIEGLTLKTSLPPFEAACVERRPGQQVLSLAISPDGASLYVAMRDDDMIHVLDSATLEERGKIQAAHHPVSLSMCGDQLLVASQKSKVVTLIDPANGSVVAAFPMDAPPVRVDALPRKGAFIALLEPARGERGGIRYDMRSRAPQAVLHGRDISALIPTGSDRYWVSHYTQGSPARICLFDTVADQAITRAESGKPGGFGSMHASFGRVFHLPWSGNVAMGRCREGDTVIMPPDLRRIKRTLPGQLLAVAESAKVGLFLTRARRRECIALASLQSGRLLRLIALPKNSSHIGFHGRTGYSCTFSAASETLVTWDSSRIRSYRLGPVGKGNAQ